MPIINAIMFSFTYLLFPLGKMGRLRNLTSYTVSKFKIFHQCASSNVLYMYRYVYQKKKKKKKKKIKSHFYSFIPLYFGLVVGKTKTYRQDPPD